MSPLEIENFRFAVKLCAKCSVHQDGSFAMCSQCQSKYAKRRLKKAHRVTEEQLEEYLLSLTRSLKKNM